VKYADGLESFSNGFIVTVMGTCHKLVMVVWKVSLGSVWYASCASRFTSLSAKWQWSATHWFLPVVGHFFQYSRHQHWSYLADAKATVLPHPLYLLSDFPCSGSWNLSCRGCVSVA
jgi:hypothetical protein